MAQFEQYTWIFALATIFSFFSAFGIGANDLANSFASSVGAKALTMWQVLIVAAVCEFTGAIFLGAGVTDTIRSKIAVTSQFKDTPDLLMFGMLAVLMAAALWDNLSCHLELPVSTTHTTVGAVVGMTLVIRGHSAVIWNASQGPFPYIKGMSVIFLSWAVSPLVSGAMVTVLYFLLRTFVLRSKNSFTRAKWVLPVLIGLTFFVITVFIIQTGTKNKTWTKVYTDAQIVGIGAAVGVGLGVLALVLLIPYLSRVIEHDHDMKSQQATAIDAAKANLEDAKAKGGDVPKALADLEVANSDSVIPSALSQWWQARTSTGPLKAIKESAFVQTITYGARYDVHDVIDDDKEIEAMWERAEVFDPKTERLFRYLQVFSAMVMSFAHGSNDVANAVGPYSAIYAIWNTGAVPDKSKVPDWILALGGAGIVCGLGTYGYKIMRVLGVKSAKLTNARGFCVELCTAATVILASRYGLPVSTTQVLCGALWAMGLFEGLKGLNWKMVLRTLFGWVLTIIVAGFVAAGITAFVVYSPSKVASDDLAYVVKHLQTDTQNMLKELAITSGSAGAPTNAALRTAVTSLNSTWAGLQVNNEGYKHPTYTFDLNNQTFILFNRTEGRPFPFTQAIF